MKNLFFLIVCAGCVGCQSVEVKPPAPQELVQRQFIVDTQLRTGLSRDEVAGVLGREIVVGYTLADEVSEQYSPVTLKNPQRSQTIQKNGKTYVVDYYLARIQTADDKITDDELLPVVFESGRLMGRGWDFFRKHFKNP